MNTTDLELAQLLCTRLCHDLAGPVGAVAAGVELIGGDPTQADAETLGLVGSSSAAASLKLKFMRSALGSAGAATQDPKVLLDGYLQSVAGVGGKAVVTWPPTEGMAAGQAALGDAWVQLVLNLCLLAFETQPACKTLSLHVVAGSDLTVTIESKSAPERPAALRPELIGAVAGDPSAPLSAKNIHGSLTGRLVRAVGGRVDLKAERNVVTVTASFPKAAA
jgi:histidine phosphotransferase ChpT